jgi:hypothetical protein
MYETTYTAGITGIKVSAKAQNGVIKRSLEATIEMPFTDDMAKALGHEATLESLKDCSLEQAKIGMSAFSASVRFYAGGGAQRSILARGKSATVNMPREEEEPPMIKIPLLSQFDEEDLVFLARNLGSMVKVRFSKKQLSLVEDEPAESEG